MNDFVFHVGDGSVGSGFQVFGIGGGGRNQQDLVVDAGVLVALESFLEFESIGAYPRDGRNGSEGFFSVEFSGFVDFFEGSYGVFSEGWNLGEGDDPAGIGFFGLGKSVDPFHPLKVAQVIGAVFIAQAEDGVADAELFLGERGCSKEESDEKDKVLHFVKIR